MKNFSRVQRIHAMSGNYVLAHFGNCYKCALLSQFLLKSHASACNLFRFSTHTHTHSLFHVLNTISVCLCYFKGFSTSHPMVPNCHHIHTKIRKSLKLRELARARSPQILNISYAIARKFHTHIQIHNRLKKRCAPTTTCQPKYAW